MWKRKRRRVREWKRGKRTEDEEEEEEEDYVKERGREERNETRSRAEFKGGLSPP